MRIKFFKQQDSSDCGPACIKMIADSLNFHLEIEEIRSRSNTSISGTSLLDLKETFASFGIDSYPVKLQLNSLKNQKGIIETIADIPLPSILYWDNNHFVVLQSISNKEIKILDPSLGKVSLSYEEFSKFWVIKGTSYGYALIVDKESATSTQKSTKPSVNKTLSYFKKYIKVEKKLISYVVMLVIASTLLGLLSPFITKIIIDKGFTSDNDNLIYILFMGQIILFIGISFTSYFETKISTKLSNSLHKTMMYDYLMKLMKVPLNIFDKYKISDLMARAEDFNRIDSFISFSLVSLVLSGLLTIVFLFILTIYNLKVMAVFLLFQVIVFLTLFYFLRKKAKYNVLLYRNQTDATSSMIEIIQGLEDIRISGSEKFHLSNWTTKMNLYFKNNIQKISIEQKQSIYMGFITNVFSLVLTLFLSNLLLKGEISLGLMITIQFILGQLQSSFYEIFNSFNTIQQLKFCFQRISQIADLPNETKAEALQFNYKETCDISINKLSFSYTKRNPPDLQLKDINIKIPKGTTTVIVGESGSGKSTLLKMLLGFYQPLSGEIVLNQTGLSSFDLSSYREKCGFVQQTGFIFNDSIINNIVQCSKEDIDYERFINALKVAEVKNFIEKLPNKENTIIGNSGQALSSGQKQRILLARTIYKSPLYLFLDEATNSLDAITESLVVNNLKKNFSDATKVIVAHRLYTTQYADNIILLDKGTIVEQGTHHKLIDMKGMYFELYQKQNKETSLTEKNIAAGSLSTPNSP